MNKLILLCLFLSFNTLALVSRPDAFDSIYLQLEDLIEDNGIDNKFIPGESILKNKLLKEILSDKKNLINDDFEISEFFRPSVEFWFSIYTQFSSKQIVIHDIENVEIVYKIMDFSQLYKSQINIFAAYHLQKKLAEENTNRIKKILNQLSYKNLKKLSDQEKSILTAIKKSSSKIPLNRRKRKEFFKNLANNIRVQSGLRDMIYQGIVNSQSFLPFMHEQFDNFKLPKELLAIAFVESSFNTEAYSKAGASGIWQFIKYTGNIFMPTFNDDLDYRNNHFIATIAALHLLRENKKILKRWDLAVTAYNAGTKHLVRAVKKFKKNKNLDLGFVLENYHHKQLGFAVKNYYAEFLALVHTLSYKDVIYPLSGIKNPKYSFKPYEINIYATHCTISPIRIAKAVKTSSPDFIEMNKQFRNIDTQFKKGTLLVTDRKFTNRRYTKISNTQMRDMRPKSWPTLVSNKGCR